MLKFFFTSLVYRPYSRPRHGQQLFPLLVLHSIEYNLLLEFIISATPAVACDLLLKEANGGLILPTSGDITRWLTSSAYGQAGFRQIS
jgi:hypothetical protein